MSGDDGEFSGVIDRIEQDITTAFLCAGVDVYVQAVCDDLSECIQDELFAFFSREATWKRGVNVDKKVHNYRPPSKLTLTDRRAKVNQEKRNSTCRTCDKISHWAGDEACPQRNQPDSKDRGKRKGKGKGKYTKFEGHIGMMVVAMNAECNHTKDH